MKDPKLSVALILSILAIGLTIVSCIYVLDMFWVIYPDRHSLGRGYWPAIVLIALCVPLFGAMALHLIKRLIRGNPIGSMG